MNSKMADRSILASIIASAFGPLLLMVVLTLQGKVV